MQLVPRGTPGAIPLIEAMDRKRREMHMVVHTEEMKAKMSVRVRRQWSEGRFDAVPGKLSAALCQKHGKACRARKNYNPPE